MRGFIDCLARNPSALPRPLSPRAGSESLMSIPMTGLVHPMNVSTNRGRRWLILGLLGGVAMTWAMWAQVMDWDAASLAGLAGESRPSPDADEGLGVRRAIRARRSVRPDALSLDPGSGRSGIDSSPISLSSPLRACSPDHRPLETKPETPITARSRRSRIARSDTGRSATTPARFPSGSGSKAE